MFDLHFDRVRRYLHRLSGNPDLADDLAQEAFVRLYRRGSPPETPGAWLVTVAMNLLRNARSKEARRRQILAERHEAEGYGDPPTQETGLSGGPVSARRVRRALDRMPERERSLLLLRAEGYSYREIAGALKLNETSVGTLVARAKRAFVDLYEEASDAP